MSERRAALVTGGGRGIGRAIAEQLAGDGWTVGVLARTAAEVEATAAAIRDGGGESIALAADVLDPAALDRSLGRFVDRAGRLDSLVCAAGRLRGVGPLGLADPSSWWLDAETSLRGVPLSIRAALPALRRSASASVSLLVGPGYNGELAHAAGYGMAQAALVRLAESLGVEFATEGHGIAVFAVYPGLVPTALMNHLLDHPDARRWLPRVTESFAEGKEVGPEVAARMISWLATARPPELTGRLIAAPQGPEILATRLARVVAENLGRLRVK